MSGTARIIALPTAAAGPIQQLRRAGRLPKNVLSLRRVRRRQESMLEGRAELEQEVAKWEYRVGSFLGHLHFAREQLAMAQQALRLHRSGCGSCTQANAEAP